VVTLTYAAPDGRQGTLEYVPRPAAGPVPQAPPPPPDTAETRCVAGLRAEQAYHMERAAEQYRRALELDPEYGPAHCGLAVVALWQGLFEEAAAHCERAGTRLAIENMADSGNGVWGSRQFGGIVEEILGLIEQIGSPALGVCLDTSHANIQRLNQPEAIRTCGEKLIALHISDNDTSGDQHKAPLYGSVDMVGVIAALREVGYQFNFNLEIPGENDRGHARPEIIELRSRYALGVCEYLLRQ
jgi:sugar phosphate isomerase/epimerase